jgi:hypothetical protein
MTAHQMATEAVIHAFAMVARPIILEYFTPRSCIASTRIAIECLRPFGVVARPVPCTFYLHIPSLNLLYFSGATAEERARLKTTNEYVELPACSGLGWQGHVCAWVEDRYWLDPSFDQGFQALEEAGKILQGVETPQIHVMELSDPIGREFTLEGKGEMEDGTETLIRYLSLDDNSFLETPAWQLDHLQFAIRRIKREMRRYLTGRRD